MNSYLAALNLYESLDEKINIGKTLNNLGTLSFSIKDYKKSEEYFLKAIEFHRANGNYTNLANTYTNLASMNSIKDNKNATSVKLN
jgi:tetratricopeptide (TPR) repeat protein